MRQVVLHTAGDVRVEDEADDDHAVVHWLTPVTDEEYAAAPAVD